MARDTFSSNQKTLGGITIFLDSGIFIAFHCISVASPGEGESDGDDGGSRGAGKHW